VGRGVNKDLAEAANLNRRAQALKPESGFSKMLRGVRTRVHTWVTSVYNSAYDA